MAKAEDTQGIADVTQRQDSRIRRPLLQVLVDLYLQKPRHTPQEERHFTELALRLLDHADAPTRREVALRLSTYPATPPALRARIAADPACSGIGAPAPGVCAGPPPTARELTEIFFAADSAERRLILLHVALGWPAPTVPPVPQHAAMAAGELEAAALARRADACMRTLERALAIAPALAYRIMHDPLGEPLVVVAKALALSPESLQRVLLVLNPVVGRSVARVYQLADLFAEIGTDAALVLCAIWRTAHPLSRSGDRGNGGRHDPPLRESTRRDRSGSPAQGALRPPPRPPAAATGTG